MFITAQVFTLLATAFSKSYQSNRNINNLQTSSEILNNHYRNFWNPGKQVWKLIFQNSDSGYFVFDMKKKYNPGYNIRENKHWISG